jgi:hypothetical protein
MVFSRVFAIVSVVAIFALTGCDKCRELANQICNCEENQLVRDSCKKNLDIQAQHRAFGRAVDENFCMHILQSKDCTCLSIANKEFEKCGMTRSVEGQ